MEIIKEVVNPEMIILFGSHAKGTFVEHRYVSKGTTYEYISDYDFLVVTKNNPEKAYVQESRVMDLAERFKPPVNMEIHEIDYINKGLGWGEYFWVDIVKEGILLYNKGTVQFVEPRELTNSEKKEKAQRYFDTWFPQGQKFLKGSKFYKNEGDLKIATFELHQATESLYYTTLLVFTDYKPKTHNLWKLRKKSKTYSEELFHVFRAETDNHEKHLFELLKQGYIDARYREDFTITEGELQMLIDRITLMIPIVEKICKEKTASLA
ncbi:HEPN domain-containing protein [Agriterribacter humi]|uniref:HEPN domain-containing protein n=1 Tax=Agriterribacter humi TaxID=1104781 RepID=UPI00186AD479|nr:HEPN domain-containing protein [Agriterribacter humi]